ncbi:MAG: serine protease, partial [Acidobacteriota bacterium]
MRLYAASSYLNLSTEKELGLQIPFDVYLQDPYVSENDPLFGFDEGSSERKSKSDKGLYVRWEPGLADGPTSSRFAVVDYNGDTGRVAPKARWDAENEVFRGPDDKPLDRENFEPLQFHQVNVWAVLQRALDFYEGGNGLGRPIPYGFEGNRLIVVPHAGYGRNAFYDRVSKSLQFYYFDDGDNRVYTCLSADIVNHEFGHAVLDGVRPYLLESSLVETGAFHEYVADMTAILIILRNNDFRHRLVEATQGDLSAENHLSRIAEEFGEAVSGKPYLRTALNKKTMSDVAGEGPHGT